MNAPRSVPKHRSRQASRVNPPRHRAHEPRAHESATSPAREVLAKRALVHRRAGLGRSSGLRICDIDRASAFASRLLRQCHERFVSYHRCWAAPDSNWIPYYANTICCVYNRNWTQHIVLLRGRQEKCSGILAGFTEATASNWEREKTLLSVLRNARRAHQTIPNRPCRALKSAEDAHAVLAPPWHRGFRAIAAVAHGCVHLACTVTRDPHALSSTESHRQRGRAARLVPRAPVPNSGSTPGKSSCQV